MLTGQYILLNTNLVWQ